MRWKLTIEYDGSPFHGWQMQKNALTVQQVIEQAIFKLSKEKVTLFAAGRTDSGVHALGQIAHCDIAKPFLPVQIQNGINAHMKAYPVSIIAAGEVADDFHARFDAVQRHYLYRIINRTAPTSLLAKHVLHVPRPLNFDEMMAACLQFEGRHDFTSFRAANCQADSPVKTIDWCEIVRPDAPLLSDELHIHVYARSFLYRQVRNMVGTLLKIGIGHWAAPCIGEILAVRERKISGPAAPAHGLYFAQVIYDDNQKKLRQS